MPDSPSRTGRLRRTRWIRRNRLVAAAVVAALVIGGTSLGLTLVLAHAQQGAAAESAASGSGDTASAAASDTDASEAAAEAASAAAAAALSPAVSAEIAYVRAHWDDTDSSEFGFLGENDCVNFASQALLARGWATDDDWWYDESGDPYSSSAAWVSSTALMEYLEEHPDRATALTDDQRASVKVGDIVQFDWDDSGDRDHTGIVTSVVTEADGSITIEYAGHTDPTFDRSVDVAIHELHPGGVAYYWSIAE